MFDWDFLIACFPELTDAFLITISAAILGFLFASIIGLIVAVIVEIKVPILYRCLLYTSPSPRDRQKSRMPSSA